MNKLKPLIGIIIVAALMSVLVACSERVGTSTDSEAEEVVEAEDDYDIAANITVKDDSAGKKIIDTDHFTLILPLGDTWDYDCDSKTSITIYNIASREAGCGGRLVSINVYDAADKDYEDLPSYDVIGDKDGKVYVAGYPTDVQFDFENEQTMQDYQTVYEIVNRIKEGSGDSPVVLK